VCFICYYAECLGAIFSSRDEDDKVLRRLSQLRHLRQEVHQRQLPEEPHGRPREKEGVNLIKLFAFVADDDAQ
jgi:hypothetical protein